MIRRVYKDISFILLAAMLLFIPFVKAEVHKPEPSQGIQQAGNPTLNSSTNSATDKQNTADASGLDANEEDTEPFDLSSLSPEELDRITKQMQEEYRQNSPETGNGTQENAPSTGDTDNPQTKDAAHAEHMAAELAKKKDAKSDIRLRAMLAAYAVWRKGFDTYKLHNATFSSDGKVSEKVHWGFKLLDTWIIKTIGGLATMAEHWDEWEKKGIVPPGLEGMMMAVGQPQIARNLQIYWEDARESNMIYERRFHFLIQHMIKFAPAVFYHWIIDKDKWNGYPSLSYNPVPWHIPNLENKGYTNEYDDANDGLGLPETQGAAEKETKGLYWGITKAIPPLHWVRKWWVGSDYQDYKKMEQGAGGWQVLGYAPIDRDNKKKDFVDSFLYRRAITSSVNQMTAQISDYFENIIIKKAGEEKINSIQEKTYGAVTPSTMVYPLCRGLANIMLYNLAPLLPSILPRFNKIDLHMAQEREVIYRRPPQASASSDDEDDAKNERKLYMARPFDDGLKGNAQYIFKEIKDQAIRSFGAYTAPLLLGKLTDKRKEVGRWINNKLLSAGQGLVKVGLCRTNPVENMQTSLQRQVLASLQDNPFVLQQLLDTSMKVHQGIESNPTKMMQRMFSGDVEALIRSMMILQAFQKAVAQVEQACVSKERLMRLQIRSLMIRTDERYKRTEAELQAAMQEAMKIIEAEGLLLAVLDTGALGILNTMAPWFSKWGADAAVSLSASIERKLVQSFETEDVPPPGQIVPHHPSPSPTPTLTPAPTPGPAPAPAPQSNQEPNVNNGKKDAQYFVMVAAGAGISIYAASKLYDWYQNYKKEAAKTPAQKQRDALIARLRSAYKDFKKDTLKFEDYNTLEKELLGTMDEKEQEEVKLRVYVAA